MTGKYKILLLAMLLMIVSIASAQRIRPSTTIIDKDKYAGPTKWSCIDKHYGYYFLSYAMPIPIEKNNIEKEGISGKFRVGYMYRYKIAKPFDIGVQLNYLRQSTGIDPTLFGTMSKISVIEHSIDCGAFMRFNFGKSDFRHLGWHIDLGADYSYDFVFLNKYVSFYDNPSRHSKIKRKDRIKDAKYRHDYGVFMRIGWNYIAFTCEYNFGDWDAYGYRRSPLMLGLQINMYTR